MIIAVVTDYCGLQVDDDRSWGALAGWSKTEEGVITIIALVLVVDGAVGQDGVFQAVQFPASICDLHASLADVDLDDFSLEMLGIYLARREEHRHFYASVHYEHQLLFRRLSSATLRIWSFYGKFEVENGLSANYSAGCHVGECSEISDVPDA